MREWLIDYGSWALAPWGLLGMYVTGRKKTWGWLLALTTQCLWALYAVGTVQYGFLVGTTAYAAVYLKNWVSWRRTDREPRPDVTALLRDLNRLELEKDRDGNAEVPWWYMRDALATALGITFDDDLPDEEEACPER